jgi:hypothetical protein
MRKWFEDFINWLECNYLIIFLVIACIILIVAIVAAILYGVNGDFDAVDWLTNPTNPASPLNIL